VHPGKVLREDYLVPMKLSAYAVARARDVLRTRIERLMREETPVIAETALRLGKHFSTTPAFWMNMQGAVRCTIAPHRLTARRWAPIALEGSTCPGHRAHATLSYHLRPERASTMLMRLVVAGLAAFALLMPLHSGALAQSTPQIRVPIDQAPKLTPNLRRSDDGQDDGEEPGTPEDESASGAEVDSARSHACAEYCRKRIARGKTCDPHTCRR
jgi:antitoxin HigA-1